MVTERNDVLNGNLVVELALIFRMLEAEACPDEIIGVEFAGGGIAEKTAYV